MQDEGIVNPSRPWNMEIEAQYSWQAEGGISVSVDIDVARMVDVQSSISVGCRYIDTLNFGIN